jgi:hypothetical protein
MGCGQNNSQEKVVMRRESVERERTRAKIPTVFIPSDVLHCLGPIPLSGYSEVTGVEKYLAVFALSAVNHWQCQNSRQLQALT